MPVHRIDSAGSPRIPEVPRPAPAAQTEPDGFRAKLEDAARKKDLDGLRKASREFEAYFVSRLLKQMRQTVLDSGLIEKSESRKTFESMLDDEYARILAEGEGIGIAKSMYEAMKKTYE